MRWLIAYISVFLVGYLVFFTAEKLDWMGYARLEQIFFIWNNIAYGSILSFASLYAIGDSHVKSLVRPVLIFSCIMFAWEIVSLVMKININNAWAEMGAFLALMLVVVWFTVMELKRAKI